MQAQQNKINELQAQALNPQSYIGEVILPPPLPVTHIPVTHIPVQTIEDQDQLQMNFNPSQQDQTNKLLSEMNLKLTKIISLLESKPNVKPNSSKASIPTVTKQSIQDQ
jgi:hypothetical protein